MAEREGAQPGSAGLRWLVLAVCLTLVGSFVPVMSLVISYRHGASRIQLLRTLSLGNGGSGELSLVGSVGRTRDLRLEDLLNISLTGPALVGGVGVLLMVLVGWRLRNLACAVVTVAGFTYLALTVMSHDLESVASAAAAMSRVPVRARHEIGYWILTGAALLAWLGGVGLLWRRARRASHTKVDATPPAAPSS